MGKIQKPKAVKTYNWLAELGYKKVKTVPSILPGVSILRSARRKERRND